MKIKGYENYEVTCSGEVVNTSTGRVLKPANDGRGYLFVVLYKNSKRKHFKVHRLVAEAFIPNPDNLPQVNHKDEDKTNNTVFVREDGSVDFDKSNLEWCTCEYNIQYSRNKPILQLRKDGSLVRMWSSVNEVQRQLHYSSGNISQCCLGKRHSAYGYKWCYAN